MTNNTFDITGISSATGGSQALLAFNVHLASIQLIWSGTPVGSLKLQASNDRVVPTNWEDIADTAVAVNGSGSQMWNVHRIGYGWIRVFFTYTSGTGTFTGTAILKRNL